tara:strand:- start:150 stop:587 length:438 start_codon:yes stop_codon:yes gene_type:complete
MPKRRIKGGSSSDPGSSSSSGSTNIGIKANLPSSIGDVQDNSGLSIIFMILLVMVLLIIVLRSQFTDIGSIGNKLSISVVGFILGISSLSCWLLSSYPQTILYGYYGLTLISLLMWLYILFQSDNFQNYDWKTETEMRDELRGKR